MPRMWWVPWVVAVVALLAAYLGWTARRVERVHVRAQSAERALDAHLVRRAAAAAVVAERHDNSELYAAARLALDADPDERESAENDLTRQLQTVRLSSHDPDLRALIGTSRRVGLARQVHTDQVRDALTARERLLVRALGMTRRYPRPQYFDIEDPSLPESVGVAVVPAPTAPLESV
jgi:hypothetical protein